MSPFQIWKPSPKGTPSLDNHTYRTFPPPLRYLLTRSVSQHLGSLFFTIPPIGGSLPLHDFSCSAGEPDFLLIFSMFSIVVGINLVVKLFLSPPAVSTSTVSHTTTFLDPFFAIFSRRLSSLFITRQ